VLVDPRVGVDRLVATSNRFQPSANLGAGSSRRFSNAWTRAPAASSTIGARKNAVASTATVILIDWPRLI
jgi:hypothetical protein